MIIAVALWLTIAPLVAPQDAPKDAAQDPTTRVRERIRAACAAHAEPGTTIEVLELPVFAKKEPTAALDVDVPPLPLAAGTYSVTVSRKDGGRDVARGLATLRVTRKIAVWVLARDVRWGAELTASDLVQETRAFSREPVREFLGEIGSVRWTARRTLQKGDVLRQTDFERAEDVSAGDDVALVTHAGDALLSVKGTCRRGGSVGEEILVLNSLTGKIVPAILASKGVAELASASPRSTRARTSGGNAP